MNKIVNQSINPVHGQHWPWDSGRSPNWINLNLSNVYTPIPNENRANNAHGSSTGRYIEWTCYLGSHSSQLFNIPSSSSRSSILSIFCVSCWSGAAQRWREHIQRSQRGECVIRLNYNFTILCALQLMPRLYNVGATICAERTAIVKAVVGIINK